MTPKLLQISYGEDVKNAQYELRPTIAQIASRQGYCNCGGASIFSQQIGNEDAYNNVTSKRSVLKMQGRLLKSRKTSSFAFLPLNEQL